MIEQDVIRIDHSDSVEDLRYGRTSKDCGSAVPALEDRVLVNSNHTVIFR